VPEVLLSRNQVAVADAVTRSYLTTPTAFIVVKVDIGGASAYARAAIRRLRTLVGLPEIAVKVLASLYPAFPAFFAGPAASVAVTIDVGTGLYLPVVPEADQIGMQDISRMLLNYRRSARHGTFRSAQLSGGTIALTLSTDGPLYSRPISFPGYVCAVSLGSMEQELYRDPHTGRISPRSVILIGLSYDRREVPTSSATCFVSALKSALESLAEQDVDFV
jgi:2-oxoglutarate dehydrogenase E2 component (dihydrolipoamide succinyltransferase)